jgi:hypothetical protein
MLVLVTGTCVAVFGNKAGEDCYRDSDCESGLLCIGRIGTCTPSLVFIHRIKLNKIEVYFSKIANE